MAKAKSFFLGVVLNVVVFLLAGCSNGLPYVKKELNVDVQHGRFGVILHPSVTTYHLTGPVSKEFFTQAVNAVEGSLNKAVTQSGGTAKVLDRAEFSLVTQQILKLNKVYHLSGHAPDEFAVDADTKLGDFRQLFKNHDLDAVLFISWKSQVWLPETIRAFSVEEINKIFNDNFDAIGSGSIDELQLLLVLPDGTIAYASRTERHLTESGIIGNVYGKSKANLIDKNKRDKMMADLYNHFKDYTVSKQHQSQ